MIRSAKVSAENRQTENVNDRADSNRRSTSASPIRCAVFPASPRIPPRPGTVEPAGRWPASSSWLLTGL